MVQDHSWKDDEVEISLKAKVKDRVLFFVGRDAIDCVVGLGYTVVLFRGNSKVKKVI
jgi:hypothetical protein